MIEEAVLGRVLGAALRTGGDFAEVFAEDRRSSVARLDDGRVEELTSGRERGAGIRVVAGETTGFAHTADLSEAGLRDAAEAAAAAARGGGGGVREVALSRSTHPAPNAVAVLPESIPKSAKVELLRRAGWLERLPHVDEISIRDIAARADIGYATFFRNYHGKAAVLHDLAADQIGQLIDLAFPAIEGSNSRAGALALCTMAGQMRFGLCRP